MAIIMDSTKEVVVVETYDQNAEKDGDEPGTVPSRYRGTANDKRDMSMLGKKQVLRVCVQCQLVSTWREIHPSTLLTYAAKI